MNAYSTLFLFLLVACTSLEKKPTPQSENLILFHESNRWGALEPCGCEVNPYGGLDREFNAIQLERAKNPMTLYVDAGNLFVGSKLKTSLPYYHHRAEGLVDILNQMGLDAFSPGPNDYALGVEFLKQLEQKAQFPWISTNVMAEDNKSVFRSHAIAKKGNLTVVFFSVSPNLPNLNIIAPVERLNRLWKKLDANAAIVLSQLSASENQKLGESLEFPNVIVGADPHFSSDMAFRPKNGQSILVDTHQQGHLLGRLSLNLTSQTFSLIEHTLIRLSREYEKPNPITQLIALQKERQRLRALGE